MVYRLFGNKNKKPNKSNNSKTELSFAKDDNNKAHDDENSKMVELDEAAYLPPDEPSHDHEEEVKVKDKGEVCCYWL